MAPYMARRYCQMPLFLSILTQRKWFVKAFKELYLKNHIKMKSKPPQACFFYALIVRVLQNADVNIACGAVDFAFATDRGLRDFYVAALAVGVEIFGGA